MRRGLEPDSLSLWTSPKPQGDLADPRRSRSKSSAVQLTTQGPY